MELLAVCGNRNWNSIDILFGGGNFGFLLKTFVLTVAMNKMWREMHGEFNALDTINDDSIFHILWIEWISNEKVDQQTQICKMVVSDFGTFLFSILKHLKLSIPPGQKVPGFFHLKVSPKRYLSSLRTVAIDIGVLRGVWRFFVIEKNVFLYKNCVFS